MSLAIDTISAMPPLARLRQAAALNRAADALALAGLRRRFPAATPSELGVALAVQRIGSTATPQLRDLLAKETTVSDTPVDFLSVAARAAAACDTLGIPYLIGGGVASTVHGEFRTTRDVDLIVRVPLARAGAFAALLAQTFVVQPHDVFDALGRVPDSINDRRQRATFAAYDRTTGYQLDVFCVSDSAYDTEQLARAVVIDVPEAHTSLRIASAEDTILTKLEWYAITPSDRQWDDVQTILRVQTGTLDLVYLDTWASRLGIAHLWATTQHGGRPPHHSSVSDDAPDPRQTRMDLN